MDNAKFGKFIREMRRERGMTQKQLADLLHVSDKAVSKWENGIGFPDIKLLESLAGCLGVTLLELMQGERSKEEQIETKEAGQVVADAISCTERAEERKLSMWKVRLLLTASGCGILYLVFVGIYYIWELGQEGVDGTNWKAASQMAPVWYENPVTFYIWVGLFVVACAGAAFFIMCRARRFSIAGVRIGRQRLKGFLTVMMDILVVLLLHTYMMNIANNQEQLQKLPQVIPVSAYLSNADGSTRAMIDIKEEVVQALIESKYVEDLNLTVRLKGGLGQIEPEEWKRLDLFLYGINRLEAIDGVEAEAIVWNAGRDASLFSGRENLCVVSRELMERNGWKLGESIEICQYYYHWGGRQKTELFLDPLETVSYEIAGYADSMGQDTGEWAAPDILLPFETVRESFYRQEIRFAANSADFMVRDALNLNDFKQEMKELGLVGASPLNPEMSYDGNSLNMNDAVFISAASRLMKLIDTVSGFFPFLLLLIVCVGYLITLLLLQSRKKEMALLRSIGVSRGRCFLIFFREQLLLVVAGVLIGSLLAVILQGNYGAGSAFVGCAVGVCYMLGNSLALYKLLQVSVMEALFRVD